MINSNCDVIDSINPRSIKTQIMREHKCNQHHIASHARVTSSRIRKTTFRTHLYNVYCTLICEYKKSEIVVTPEVSPGLLGTSEVSSM